MKCVKRRFPWSARLFAPLLLSVVQIVFFFFVAIRGQKARLRRRIWVLLKRGFARSWLQPHFGVLQSSGAAILRTHSLVRAKVVDEGVRLLDSALVPASRTSDVLKVTIAEVNSLLLESRIL